MPRTKFTAKEMPSVQPIRSKRTKPPTNKPRRTKAPAMHPSCQSCRQWRGSVMTVYDEKNPMATRKDCRVLKKEISPLDKGCMEFNPGLIFYCYIKSVFMYAEACAHRNKEALCETCEFCKHGKALRMFLRSHPAAVA